MAVICRHPSHGIEWCWFAKIQQLISIPCLDSFIKMKQLFLLPVLLALSSVAGRAQSENLAQQFETPPPEAQPWAFWMWLHTDTTPGAITRDLEQMKAKGIAGFTLYDAGTDRAGPAGREYHYRTVVAGKEFRYVQADDLKDAYVTALPTKPLNAWTPRWRELIQIGRASCRERV